MKPVLVALLAASFAFGQFTPPSGGGGTVGPTGPTGATGTIGPPVVYTAGHTMALADLNAEEVFTGSSNLTYTFTTNPPQVPFATIVTNCMTGNTVTLDVNTNSAILQLSGNTTGTPANIVIPVAPGSGQCSSWKVSATAGNVFVASQLGITGPAGTSGPTGPTGATGGNGTFNHQGVTSAISLGGGGSDVTLYSYTLPANALPAGGCVDIRFAYTNTLSGTLTVKLKFGTYVNNIEGTTVQTRLEYFVQLCNKNGATNAQDIITFPLWSPSLASWYSPNNATVPDTASIDTTTSQTILITANASAGGGTVTGQWFTVR
jgi:hypothetical protein